MNIPEEKQYEYLTKHLQYLNEKIIGSFTLFIKLATAIIGGVFFLYWNIPEKDPRRVFFVQASNMLFLLVSVSMVFLILNNLRSWRKYRVTLSEQYPDIPIKNGMWWMGSEVLMCIVIALTCLGFFACNPLSQ